MRQKNNISKIIRWRDYSAWVSCSACWGLSELACFCQKRAVIHLLHPNHGANKLSHTSIESCPPISSPICQTCTCNPSAFFIPRYHLSISSSPPCFPPLCNSSLQLSSGSSCGLQTKDDLQLPSRKKKERKKIERKEKIDAVPRKHSDMPFLGKCLLTRVHTCFWSTHHQSSIKFTQANHANHQ